MTLFMCLCNGLAIMALSYLAKMPDWFVILHGVSICIMFFGGCVYETRREERIESLETEVQKLENKLIYAVAKHNRLEEEIKKNERYH